MTYCNYIFSFFVIFIFGSTTFSQQVCKPKLTVNFPSNSFEINEEINNNISQLIENLDIEKEYNIQLICSADSIGSLNYNYNLAKERGQSISKLFQNSNLQIEVIDIINKGETYPKVNNSNEINRQTNRYVDIVVFPIEDENITLTGKYGTRITINKNYFSPCSICESDPKIIEILNATQASERGISLITTDGMELITGGMIQLEFNCPQRSNDTCLPAIIEFPIDTVTKVDSLMQLWESVETPLGIRWEQVPNRTCKPDGKTLITKIDCFEPANGFPRHNCDVKKCKNIISTPIFKRIDCRFCNITNDTTIITTIGSYIDSSFKVFDIGFLDTNKIIFYQGIIGPFINGEGHCNIPISAYTSFSFPVLIRKDLSPSLTFLDNYGLKLLDFGTDIYNIQYKLDKTIEEIQLQELFETTSAHNIPIDYYSKNLSFFDSTYVVKLPKRLVQNVELNITPIDSLMPIENWKNKSNKYIFNLPKHPTTLYLTMKDSSKYNNPFLNLDSYVVKTKYKKRKKYHLLKIKKKKLLGSIM